MKLNKNISGTQITDELFQRSSVTATRLAHDTIRSNTFAIRTESGGGGTLLVLNTDYTLGGIDSRLTTEAGVNVFTTVAIINATYHNVDLYATYLTVGDYAEAGDSLPNNVKVESVTGNHTATAPTAIGRTTVIVDATTATITIPDGVPIGGEILVKKIASTQGTITIARSGTDVFTRASLTSVTLNADGDFWLLQKVSATRWDLIDGYHTGSNSNGVYKRTADGRQECEINDAGSAGTEDSASGGFAGQVTWTYPIAFSQIIHASSIATATNRFAGTAGSLGNSSCSLRHFSVNSVVSPTTIRGFATGRWYA